MINVYSDNSIISFVFRSALTNDTLLGNNFRYILYKCGFNRNTFDPETIDYKILNKKVIDNWNACHINDDIKIGCHINELVQRRDALEPWILKKAEIQNVIDMLATA